MKKILITLLVIFISSVTLSLIPIIKDMISLFNYQDYLILDGYYNKEEYWDTNGFQDYTDYCKYYYNENTFFSENTSYKRVSITDIKTLKSYFNNFYNWMNIDNRLNEYDFQTEVISSTDYYYIENKNPSNFDSYTIYYYDTESKILYYIHSNI